MIFKTRRKSSLMITVTIILLLFIGMSGLYSGYIAVILQDDAQIINKLGLIRGSVQRLVQLELVHIQDHDLIKQVDGLLDECSIAEVVGPSFPELQVNWDKVKQNIWRYRQNPSELNAEELIDSSEVFWSISNSAVFVAQRLSEKKLRNFKILMVLFVISWCLTALILTWLKHYVRDSLELFANFDSLTKAANRALYSRILEKECERASKKPQYLSLLMFDIDHFKEINDTYGHSVGDYVLRKAARVVQKNVRKDDVLARIGGEEFAVIAPNTSVQEAVMLGEKLRKVIEETPMGKAGSITVSVGVAEFKQGDSPSTLFERADAALYKAKEHGRNQTEWVTS